MKISKKDALSWMTFFSEYQEQEWSTNQQEIILSVFAQIETAENARREALMKQIPGLKMLKNRTYYVGRDEKFSKGCISCLTGTGLGAIRKTNKCNVRCKFCYNFGQMDSQPPIGEGMWEIGGTRFYEEDLDVLLSMPNLPTGVAYVYLEPFMEIEKYYSLIKKFAKAGIYQHLYTNGTLATRENLQALSECGLNELRFNLGASNCSDKVIESIKLAKTLIPAVGVETPMTKEFFASFHEKKEKILSTGLDFLNMAELHLNENNIGNYEGEPMYISRQGYISPIWSRELTLKLMRECCEEDWDIAIHDCSNRTKFTRDLNLKAHEGGWFGMSEYGCEFEQIPYEVFLPVLSDESFEFVEQEEMSEGFKPGQLIL